MLLRVSDDGHTKASATGTGPSAESLQGRNPRAMGNRLCGLLYGDIGFAPTSVVIFAPFEPVTAACGSRQRRASDRHERSRAVDL